MRRRGCGTSWKTGLKVRTEKVHPGVAVTRSNYTSAHAARNCNGVEALSLLLHAWYEISSVGYGEEGPGRARKKWANNKFLGFQ